MATNFYATELPNEEEIAEIQKLTAKRQLQAVKQILENIPTYHIGKRSGGWQFLFAPHIKIRSGFWNSGHIVSPWENNLKSIKEYLSRDDVKIEDEYGRAYTCDQFFKEIPLYNDPEKAINGDQYYQKYPEEKSGLFLERTEFITDEGLRFSTDEDFS